MNTKPLIYIKPEQPAKRRSTDRMRNIWLNLLGIVIIFAGWGVIMLGITLLVWLVS